FVAIAKREGWYSEDLMRRIAEAGHIHFDEVPAKWQRIFVTAHDVTPEWHIRMQAAFQEFTDSAISKTCNFPHEATEQDVREIYELAFRLNCKGVTVYRDGSREMQVLSTGSTAKKVQAGAATAETAAAAATLGTVAAADAVATADLRATIAELESELARTRQRLHEVESEN